MVVATVDDLVSSKAVRLVVLKVAMRVVNLAVSLAVQLELGYK